MIQLGSLEIDNEVLENPMGAKIGQYKPLSTGEEIPLSEPVSTLRIRFRIKKSDVRYQQLIELARNSKIGALPLHTGHHYIDGLYLIKSLRDEPLNFKWQELIIVLERAGQYYNKIQEAWLRYDEWNVIYKEDFQSSPTELLNMKVFNDDTVTLYIDTGYYVSGTKSGYVYHGGGDGLNAVLFGFDYWRNYEVSCWFRSESNTEQGMMWRCETGNFQGYSDLVEAGNLSEHRGIHYELVLDPVNNQIRVEYHSSWDQAEDSDEIIYSEDHDDIAPDVWYKLKVITIGYTHFCFVNGRMITYFEDKRCKGGSCGLFVRSNGITYVRFDDIMVREVPVSVLVLDESYTEDITDLIKTRLTTRGQVAYAERQSVSYKAGAGSVCILNLRFDQGYGDMVYDQSRYNHHARIVNGEWKDGYMRFAKDTDGIIIPYDSDLSNTSEGTVIIRMRKHGTVTGTDPIIERGSTDWSIFLKDQSGVDQLHSCCQNSVSAYAAAAPRTGFSPHTPSSEWKTYVVRWKDSITRWEIYCDGVGAGADDDGSEVNGSNTTSDMVIGNADIDIEYLAIFDRWLEYPEIPGSIGVRIHDVDTHHEDELMDIRFDRKYWSPWKEYWTGNAGNTIALVGSPVYQDYNNANDQKPLLYRRSGLYCASANGVTWPIADHLKNRMHEMDWTIELIVNSCEPANHAEVESLVIGNSANTIQTVKIVFKTSGSPYGYAYRVRKNDAGTQGDVFYSAPDNLVKGTAIMHLTYHASTKTLKAYWFGEYQNTTVLTLEMDSITDTVHIGADHEAVHYRTRIIGKCLTRPEIEELVNEHMGKPIQVFHQHEFKGRPELENGLISMKANHQDLTPEEHGENLIIEVFDEGAFKTIDGWVPSTDQPIEIDHMVSDEEAAYRMRAWDNSPVVKEVGQDSAALEFRMQTQTTDYQLMSSGLQMTQRVELAIGLFAPDFHFKMGTRCKGWELRFRNNDMQACWREGGHCPREENVIADQRGNFYAASGNTHTPVAMDTSSSFAHLSNLTVMLNLNFDRSSWNDRDFMIGFLPEHCDDYLYVDIQSGDTNIEQFWFDDLHKRIGGEFRLAVAFVPYDNTKVFSDISNQSPFSWTPTNYSNSVAGSATSCFNDNLMLASGTLATASIYKAKNVDPGTFKLWWNQFGETTTNRIRQVFRAWTAGTPKVFRNVKFSDTKNEDADPALWIDSELVVNEDVATSITFEEILYQTDNNGGTVKLDGLVIIPCYNGADFILDQLYSARALKNIKRFSS